MAALPQILSWSAIEQFQKLSEGATWQAGDEMKFMNNFINIQTSDENVPSSDDSTQGKETALKLIGNGCDVVFAIGGDAVNGALLAAKETNLPAVGADVDQYNTDPEVQSALIEPKIGARLNKRLPRRGPTEARD